MRRILALASISVAVLLLAGCAHSVAVRELDRIPSSVAVGGATAEGGEPAVGWGPTHKTFYVAVVATGICTGIPTSVEARGPHAMMIGFSSSPQAPCPPKEVAWQLEVPSAIDVDHAVKLTLTVPDDGSIADDGRFLRTLEP